jgi:hypothetical protein
LSDSQIVPTEPDFCSLLRFNLLYCDPFLH